MDTIQRFMSKINIDSETGCWIWTGSKCRGYGKFYNKGTFAAHRFSWEIKNGKIPDGFEILHNCPGGDNPACVNPDHLKLGTHYDNMRDMIEKGRDIKAKGEQQGNSVLTENDIFEIKSLYSDGMFQREIAEIYGVHQVHISRIIRNKSWEHLSSY